MLSNLYISALTALVTGVFAGMVFERYLKRRSPYLLAWGIGLLLYSVGTVAQAVLVTGFDPWLFKLWYWSGAMLVALWLGQGTVFLLVRKGNRAWISFWLIVALSLVAALVIFPAAVNSDAYRVGVDLTEQYQDLFAMSAGEKTLRTVLVITMNTYGTLMLVGGAVYSAYLFARKQVLPHRMWGNVLIAIGGLLPALGGTLILLGQPALKYVGQLLGGVFLFAGFLVASHTPVAVRSVAPAAPVESTS
ncbi:MAG: hypothetical protein Kow00124_13190 [Anaerolineae bacterium]